MSINTISTKNKIEDGLFKISRFKEMIKKTQPHKHEGYFELIFLSQGEGFHWIETENFKVAPPDLFFMKPGQMHCWQFTSIPKGYVVLFKEEFLDPIQEAPLMRMIGELNTLTRVNLAGRFDPIPLMEGMLDTYQQPSPYTKDIILGHIRSLFGILLSLSSKVPQQAVYPSEIYENFMDLLSRKCPSEANKVQDFADLLHTSPQNLNLICRKNSQLSANQHITQQLLLEAKRNILHTDKSINELADLLRFNDGSYFVKFFKRHTGETPNQFRSRYLQ